MQTEKTTIFNVYTGEIYDLHKSELKNILEGEIPLLKRPKSNCKTCYGRGYAGYDSDKRSYCTCNRCVDKQLDTKYLKEIKYTCLVLRKGLSK